MKRYGLLIGIVVSHFAAAEPVIETPGDAINLAYSAELRGEQKTALAIYKKLAFRKETRERALMGQARILMEHGNLDQSSSVLQELLNSENPFHLEGRLLFSEVLRRQSSYETALKEVERVAVLRPDELGVIEQKAKILFDLKDHTANDVFLSEKEKVGIKLSSRAQILRAKARAALKKYELALSDFKMVLQERPGDIEALDGQAQIYVDQKQWMLAEKSYTKLTQLMPTSVSYWESLGATLDANGNFKSAESAFKKALILDPSSASCSYKLASAYKKQNQLDRAEEQYRKTLKLDSEHESAAFELTELFIKRKQMDRVGEFLGQYTQQFPNRKWAMLTYAKLLISIHLNERAISVVTRMREQGIPPLEAILIEAKAHYEEKNLKKSQQILLEAEAQHQSNPAILFNLAMVSESLDEFEEASNRYQKLFDDPDYGFKSKINLALMLEKKGAVSESIKILKDTRAPASFVNQIRRKIESLEAKAKNPEEKHGAEKQ